MELVLMLLSMNILKLFKKEGMQESKVNILYQLLLVST